MLENLALACVSCSLHKAAKVSGFDEESQKFVILFNPRNMKWEDHFFWQNEVLVGLTPTGRGTVFALQMNRANVLAIRKEEAFWGRHP